ncbi:MAG: peptidyl-prolyl cis-trans isomerase, peptidylprolyl isomerase [Candidatus Peregrinibacteria bacterium GW2011_GWE2_39_6]|nr:MAG: peptidyl-prolyl cis-trans isomerase, peptidylprolyl isomerase [Candidatus Peregrinibacteria bacterium GW2011_GWF2_39_17]KKR26658.1 MAG: peptidyl-prolyl cis-trans isomerase, peptidylprolyl isomerase [Candidatus Peregrinibacteria bacterium GW2011_GWE2_39_6]HCW32649.1 peptidylprolyl isomerase [Candidatus Peregrinibacteria bacterium]
MKKIPPFLGAIIFILTLGIISIVGCGNKLGGPVISENGLEYTDLVVGYGETAKTGDTLSMNYIGTLEDGTKFDSSYDRGTPFSFTLGASQVIPGWDQGIEGMKVGGKRKLTIPSSLAYGEGGVPGIIPGNSTLIFEVELLGIQSSS